MQPAVLIRCDAGAVHGLGHLIRCRSLARALAGMGRAAELRAFAPPDVLSTSLEAKGVGYGIAEHPIGSAADQDAMVGELRNAGAPRTVILDSRELPPSYVSALGAHCDLVCVDDEQYRDLDCRLLVNPNPWAEARQYAARGGRAVAAGAPFCVVDPAFAAAGKLRRQEPQDPARVLITMGGEDPDNVATAVVARLATIPRRLNVTVVLGPAFRGHDDVRRAARDSPHEVVIVERCNDLAALVPEIDVAISSASTTSYELASAGVPTILIVLADHQLPVARYFQRSASALVPTEEIGCADERLHAALQSLLAEAYLRRDLQKRALTIFDGLGAARVAASVLTVQAK